MEALILGSAEEVERVAPDLALRNGGRRVGGILRRVAAAQPRRDVVQRDLLDEGHPVAAVVPPFENQNQS